MSDWQPMETCPNNDDFRFYGLHVNHKNGHSWFEVHYVCWDDDGVMKLPSGDNFDDWAFSDFECWLPAPSPPTSAPEPTGPDLDRQKPREVPDKPLTRRLAP